MQSFKIIHKFVLEIQIVKVWLSGPKKFTGPLRNELLDTFIQSVDNATCTSEKSLSSG